LPHSFTDDVAWFLLYANTYPVIAISVVAATSITAAIAVSTIANLGCFILSLAIYGVKIQNLIYLG
jgi:hypothetical protein